MTNYNLASDLITPDPLTIKRNKKKINELLDKYGSREAILQSADLADSLNYDFIHGDDLIDEVLKERALTQNNQTSQNNPLQPNQSALAREAKSVHDAYHHDEETDENLTQSSHDESDRASKDDELKIDYSKYGNGFSKEFVNQMLVDNEFNKILEEYLIPNEGGYNNDKDDSGGETNMGISQTTHKNENIKKLTRERANAIYYRDYYNWNGLNKLPYQIRGFIVDFGALSSPETAIKLTHKVLGIPEGNIIGNKTLNKLKTFTKDDFKDFLKQYQSEMTAHFHQVVKIHPERKKYLQGWINRANRAHLAK